LGYFLVSVYFNQNAINCNLDGFGVRHGARLPKLNAKTLEVNYLL